MAWFATRRGFLAFEAGLRGSAARLLIAAVILALVLLVADLGLARLWAPGAPRHDVPTLALLAGIGAVAYGGAVIALFGKKWIAALQRGGSK